MPASDRDRIRNTAREHGWAENSLTPLTLVFSKGHRMLSVRFRKDGSVEAASHGSKDITGRDISRSVVELLKKQ